MKYKRRQYRLVLDTETGNVDPKKTEILELAYVILDEKDRQVSALHVLKPNVSWDVAKSVCDAWCLNAHTESDLLNKNEWSHINIEPWPIAYERITNCLLKDIDSLGSEGDVYLMGFSPQFDRDFLKEKLPKVAARLHHRNVDISGAWRALRLPSRTSNHRAADDVLATVSAARKLRIIGKVVRPFLWLVNLIEKVIY